MDATSRSATVKAIRADNTVHHKPVSSHSFGVALCKHFGLPGNKVQAGVQMETREGEVFGVMLKIALTPQDLECIARLMAE